MLDVQLVSELRDFSSDLRNVSVLASHWTLLRTISCLLQPIVHAVEVPPDMPGRMPPRLDLSVTQQQPKYDHWGGLRSFLQLQTPRPVPSEADTRVTEIQKQAHLKQQVCCSQRGPCSCRGAAGQQRSCR